MKLQQVLIKTVNGDIEITSVIPPEREKGKESRMTLMEFIFPHRNNGLPFVVGARKDHSVKKEEGAFVDKSKPYRLHKGSIPMKKFYKNKEDALEDLGFYMESIKVKQDGMEIEDVLDFELNESLIISKYYRLIN